jgi:large subunit ribosomal protein L10
MAVTRDQKKVLLGELKEKFENASSIIFANYIGLKVGEVSELRKKLKAEGAEMKVAKKTLMRLAAEETGLPAPEESVMNGPVACIFSFQDPLVGARVAFTFGKDHPQVAFLGGLFEKKLLSKDQANILATIPTRPVLLAIFAGMIRSPLTKFASICASPLTGFARALSELEKKGGLQKSAAPAVIADAPAPAAA